MSSTNNKTGTTCTSHRHQPKAPQSIAIDVIDPDNKYKSYSLSMSLTEPPKQQVQRVPTTLTARRAAKTKTLSIDVIDRDQHSTKRTCSTDTIQSKHYSTSLTVKNKITFWQTPAPLYKIEIECCQKHSKHQTSPTTNTMCCVLDRQL
jgi:hypothetical protein